MKAIPGLKTWMVLIGSLWLVSCGLLPRQVAGSFSFQELKIAQEDEAVYLKPYEAHLYPPQAAQLNDQESITVKQLSGVEFQQFTLKNGLQVLILPRLDLPTITISAVVYAGRAQVSADDELLSPLVVKLLKQGTEKYSRTQFQNLATRLGEPMQYRQTPQFSLVSVTILPQDLALALALFAQQLAYIKPDDHSVKTAIQEQLLENKLAQSSGLYWAKQFFYQTHYPANHPYYAEVPERRKIKAVNQNQLMNFYKQHYLPNRTRLILVGDINPQQAQNLIEQHFTHWQAGKPFAPILTLSEVATMSNKTPRIDLVHRKGAQQADILFGAVTVAGNSVDKTALDMLAALLGGGPNSRLFADLREQKGLTYSISAYQQAGRYQSPFFIQTSVAHEKVARTIVGIQQHIDYLCRQPMDFRELEQLKRQLTGERLFQLQTNRQWLNEKIRQLESGLEAGYISEQIRQINAMTTQGLKTVMNKYLCQSQQYIVVGQAPKLTEHFHRRFDD